MNILEINYNLAFVIIGIAGIVIGLFSGWIAKLLDDKKSITLHDIKIEHLEKRMDNVEDDIDELKSKK